MQLNKESLASFIQNLLQRITFISELNEKLESSERSIVLSEKAKIYLDESLTLHNEPNKTKNTSLANQHSVYSLHDRYAQYLEYAQNLEKVYDLVDNQIEHLETLFRSNARLCRFMGSFNLLVNYLEPEFKSTNSWALLNSILIFDGKLNGLFNEQHENEAAHFQISNYSAVSEFLNSIGQGQIVKQCETIYSEINQSREERKSLSESAFWLIMNHVELFSWFSDRLNSNEKLTKLLEWLRAIRSTPNSYTNYGLDSILFKEICKNFMQVFDPKFKTKIVKKTELELSGFDDKAKSISVQSKFLTLSGEIGLVESRMANLKIRKITAEAQHITLLQIQDHPTEQSFADYIDYELAESNGLDEIFESLNFVWIQFLNDNLQKWLTMESVSSSVSKEQLVMLSSQEGDWFLEEILSLVLNCANLARLLRSLYTRYNRLIWPNQADDKLSLASSLDIFEAMSGVFLNLKELIYNYERGQFESLFNAVSNNKTDAEFVINEFQSMNIDEFFMLISDEGFQAQHFSANIECMQKMIQIRSRYSDLLANNENKVCSMGLAEMEKTFSRVEAEFEKCVHFCKFYYSQQMFLNQTFFTLTPNLVRFIFKAIYFKLIIFYHVLFERFICSMRRFSCSTRASSWSRKFKSCKCA